MNNLGEYLRAYWAYVSTSLGWGKALLGAIVWLAGSSRRLQPTPSHSCRCRRGS